MRKVSRLQISAVVEAGQEISGDLRAEMRAEPMGGKKRIWDKCRSERPDDSERDGEAERNGEHKNVRELAEENI